MDAEQYESAMARIDQIFEAEPGTPEGDELLTLVAQVQDYEMRCFGEFLADQAIEMPTEYSRIIQDQWQESE